MRFDSPGSEQRKKMGLSRGKMGKKNSAISFSRLPQAEWGLTQEYRIHRGVDTRGVCRHSRALFHIPSPVLTGKAGDGEGSQTQLLSRGRWGRGLPATAGGAESLALILPHTEETSSSAGKGTDPVTPKAQMEICCGW